MRRAVLLAAAALAVAAPANAQTDEFVEPEGGGLAVFGGGHGRTLAILTAEAAVAGGVSVSFQGRGVSGTVTWRPRVGGEIYLQRVRTKEGPRWFTALLLSDGFAGAGPTVAVVRRTRADGTLATCVDHGTGGPGFGSWTRADAVPMLRLGDVLSMTSRCAGPRLGDIAAALPEARLRLRSGTIADLSGERAFAAAGFTGIVRSDFRVRVGEVRRDGGEPAEDADDFAPGVPRRTVLHRSLQVEYDVVRASGAVRADVRGSADAMCEPLDSCGRSSTITLRPLARGSDGFLVSQTERGGVGFADLRRAARLERFGPLTSGIRTFAAFDLAGVHTVAAGEDCRSTVRGARLSLYAVMRGPVARLRLMGGYGGDPMRTRCPGPMTGTRILATGIVPRGALGARTVDVRLGGSRSFTDDGWDVRTYSTLTLRLRRVGVERETFRSYRFG